MVLVEYSEIEMQVEEDMNQIVEWVRCWSRVFT